MSGSLDQSDNSQTPAAACSVRRVVRSLVLLPGACVLLGLLALLVDLPLAKAVYSNEYPRLLKPVMGFVGDLSRLSEVFAHGLGVLLIVCILFVLDPDKRYRIPRILTASLGAGIVANCLKLLVARSRPKSILADFQGSILDTFGGWLPLGEGGSSLQSFPSAHTATGVGFAVILVYLYPRGKYLFPVLAFFTGLQRVMSSAHFPSDVCWGAAVGLLVGGLCVHSPLFDWLESRLLRRKARFEQ